MTGKSEDVSAAAPEALTAEAVGEYLRRHPDFLVDDPELLAVLTPPELRRGDGVVDMQRFMIGNLRRQAAAAASRESTLLAAAEDHVASQERVQRAALALLSARSFEHLTRIVSDQLAEILDLAACRLCFETGDGLPAGTAVAVLGAGAIDARMGRRGGIVLVEDTTGDEAVFAADAAKIRSLALLHLAPAPAKPAAMLALGSSQARGFYPDQGTELLSFFARVTEHCVRRWLAETP